VLDDQPGAQLRKLRRRPPRFSPSPTASMASICSSVSADGGTVRSRRRSSCNRLSRDLRGPTPSPHGSRGHLQQLGHADQAALASATGDEHERTVTVLLIDGCAQMARAP
jgi:hypothetical protein